MFAYRKAVTAIKSLDIDITDADQLEGLPGVGDGIIRKIREFIADGTIKKFEFIDTDERTLTIQLLEGVWGLGPKGAEKLYNKGIKSIDDLRKNEDLLTKMQKIGLKYYEDFKERIPREEVDQLLQRFRKSAYQEVKDGEKVMSVEACGSYRRGRPNCGDIDVLITLKDGTDIKGLCEKLVIKLEKENFLKERLGDFRYSTTGSEGYMGVC